MDRWVTPPKRVPSPIWGTPPPCKQALNFMGCLAFQRGVVVVGWASESDADVKQNGIE